MIDKLNALDDAQDFMLTCQKEDEADALEWAIDQLRWRRVEDELPPTSEGVRHHFYGRNAVPKWVVAVGTGETPEPTAKEEFLQLGYTHWRPITLPEGK